MDDLIRDSNKDHDIKHPDKKKSWKHKRWTMLWSTVIYYILNVANKLQKKLCHIEHKECLALFHGGHSQASD